VSCTAIILCVASQRAFVVVVDFIRLSPETFGYTLVFRLHQSMNMKHLMLSYSGLATEKH